MTNNCRTAFSIGETINELLDDAQVAGVNCQCVGTMVVLRGKVDHPLVRQKAISIARKCCGMNEIANEIHVVG